MSLHAEFQRDFNLHDQHMINYYDHVLKRSRGKLAADICFRVQLRQRAIELWMVLSACGLDTDEIIQTVHMDAPVINPIGGK